MQSQKQRHFYRAIPVSKQFSFKAGLGLWLCFVCALCALGGGLASQAQNGPTVQSLEVGCGINQRKKSQRGLKRPQADGNAWPFQVVVIAPATIRPGTLKWTIHIGGQNYTFPAVPAALSWGSFLSSATSQLMTWTGTTNANAGGAFSVSATGKLDCGGAVGPAVGVGEDVAFEANWSGAIETPKPDKKCSVKTPSCDECEGSCSLTEVGVPCPITPKITTNSPVGPNAAVGAIAKADGTSTDTLDSTAVFYQTNAKIVRPGGDEVSLIANGAGGWTSAPGEEEAGTLAANGDGSYDFVSPDGNREVYVADANGALRLKQIKDVYGNALTITRNAGGVLQSVQTADGNSVSVSHDAAGRIQDIEDSQGRKNTISYNAGGRISAVAGSDGRDSAYKYDAQGRLTEFTGALGTTKYTYEGGSNGADGGETQYSAPGQPMGFAQRTTVEHPDGSKEEYFWDGYGNMVHVAPEDYVAYVDATTNNASPDVPKTITKYESIAGEDRVTQVTDATGNVSKIEYDTVSGLPVKVTAADGSSATTTYNAKGNPLVVTDADGKATTFEYAANGQDVTKVKDAQGNTTATYTYDADRNVLTSTDADGKTTTFTYDANHHVLTTTDSDNKTTTYTYTAWGGVASETDSDGKTTTFTYNADKLVTSVVREGSTLASYTYDAKQRVATQTDTLGLTLAYTYDNADRVLKVIYPDGTFEETSYSACCGVGQAKPALTRDRAGRTTEYVYDQMGRMIKVIDPSGNDVEYLYDVGGKLTQLKDTKNNATSFTYDANGQVTKKTYADGTFEQMTYNNVGQLIGARDAKNNVVSYEYDVAGRVTKLDYPNLTDVTMSYDALGRLSTKSDAVGTSAYAYDALDRITSIDGPWDNDTISYSYDSKGRQTALSINGATQANYAYDSFDRLTSVSKGTQTFGYGYNGASSQLTQLTTPGGKTNYSYDAMQHLTSVQSVKADNATNLAKFDYGYNTRDVRTSVEKTIGNATAQTVNYTYDQIDQLTKELSTEQNPTLNKEYSYDAMGNRITSSVTGASTAYTANNLNQITQTSLGGNNTAIVYDANGNTIQQGAKTFGYNDADQLTSVVVPNEKKSEFVYDSDGRKRIAKEFTWQNGAWVQSDETRFVYDGMDLVQERGADGTVKASYVRDGNIGGVLSTTNADGTFYYHYDGGGNVVALTDSNENIVASYSYDAFGNTLSSSGAQADKNPFRFSSKYYDGDTGLYDYGLRHYDSSLGRWINRDLIAEEGGLNLYGIVRNNPTNLADSYGMEPVYMTSALFNRLGKDRVGDSKVYLRGGTEAERRGVSWMVHKILQTKHGSQWKDLEVTIYLQHNGTFNSQTKVRQNGSIFIELDLDANGCFQFTKNKSVKAKWGATRTPLEAILAHELGHAAGTSGESANMKANENPVRVQLGLPPRTSYDVPRQKLVNGRWVLVR